MNLRCPIPREYREYGNLVYINQRFGENAGRCFDDFCYTDKGHTGLDLRTVGAYKCTQANKLDWTEGKFPKADGDYGFERVERNKYEANGRIPLLAAIEGKIDYKLRKNKEKYGWAVTITHPSGDYRVSYAHIETPWDRIATFMGWVKTKVTDMYASRGEVVSIAGNSGFSTGPHVHITLEIKTDGEWKRVDPLKHLMDDTVIYRAGSWAAPKTYYYKGEEISKNKADKLRDKFPDTKLL